MTGEHFVWWLLTTTCVVWYCTITVYVVIKGSADIKDMLKRLRDSAEKEVLEASKDWRRNNCRMFM